MSDTFNSFSQKRKFPYKCLIVWIRNSLLANKLKRISQMERFSIGVHAHSFTHCHARFSFYESRGGSSPRRTRNTSRSIGISNSSAGSTPRRYQARSEMQSLHLVLGRTLGRFPVGVDCSLKDLVCYSFRGHCGHMAELT